MSRDRQSAEERTPGVEARADTAAGLEQAPIVYWNLCQAIPPIVIASPEFFFGAQAIALVPCAAAALVLLLIF
jgi:hypothetical protein